MIGHHIKEFRDWREAAEASMSRRAISRDLLTVVVPVLGKVMRLRAQLVIAIPGTMSYVFQSANGIPIHYLPRPHARDIDRVAWWRAW